MGLKRLQKLIGLIIIFILLLNILLHYRFCWTLTQIKSFQFLQATVKRLQEVTEKKM